MQADVTGIIDEDGQPVVRYVYDAWGRTIEMTGSMAENLGRLNPFRYRSYIYDPETELYYLGSRYYSPEQSRFINADVNMGECGTLITHNVFTYCGNSATMYSDASGEFFEVAAIMSVAAMSFLSIIALGVALTAFALLVHNAISKAPPDVYRETDSTAEIIQQAALEIAEKYQEGKKYKGHSVYLLVEDNVVFYVGRTTEPGRRLKEHMNRKFPNRQFDMRIVMSGLSENKAKVIEQFLISAFFGIYLQNARINS